MKKLTLTIITLTSLMIGSVSMANGSKDCPYRVDGEIYSKKSEDNYKSFLPGGFAPSVSPTQATAPVKSTGG